MKIQEGGRSCGKTAKMNAMKWDDLIKHLPNALKDNYTSQLYVIGIAGYLVTNSPKGLSVFNDIDECDYDKVVIVVNNKLMDFLMHTRTEIKTVDHLAFLVNHPEFKEAGQRKPKIERTKRRRKKSRRKFRKKG